MESAKELLKEVQRFIAEVERCPLCSFDIDEHGKHHPKRWKNLKARIQKVVGAPDPS
jgi:hypothetical protein